MLAFLGAVRNVGQGTLYDFGRLTQVLFSIGVGQGLRLRLLPGIRSCLGIHALKHHYFSAFLIHFSRLLP